MTDYTVKKRPIMAPGIPTWTIGDFCLLQNFHLDHNTIGGIARGSHGGWNGTLYGSVIRGSAAFICLCDKNLCSDIFHSIFAHNTHPWHHGVGVSLTTLINFGCLWRGGASLNSIIYVWNIV